MVWGLWLTLSSLGALANLNAGAPSATLYGAVYLAALVILGLSITLFSTIELSRLAPLSKEKVEETPAEDKKKDGETELPKVEGF